MALGERINSLRRTHNCRSTSETKRTLEEEEDDDDDGEVEEKRATGFRKRALKRRGAVRVNPNSVAICGGGGGGVVEGKIWVMVVAF